MSTFFINFADGNEKQVSQEIENEFPLSNLSKRFNHQRWLLTLDNQKVNFHYPRLIATLYLIY